MQTKYCLLALIITLSSSLILAEEEAASIEKNATTVNNEESANRDDDVRRSTRQTNAERNAERNVERNDGDAEEDIEQDGLIGRWRNDGRALEPKWRDGDNLPLVPFSHYSRGRPGDLVIKSSKDDRLAHARLKERGRLSADREEGLPRKRVYQHQQQQQQQQQQEDRGRRREKGDLLEAKVEAEKAKGGTRQRSRDRFDFGASGYRETFQARANEYEQELNDEEYLKPRPRKRRPPQNYEFVLAASEASSRKAEIADNAKNYQPTRPWNSKSAPQASSSGKLDGNRFDKAIELKSLLKMQQEEGLSLSEVLQRKNLTLQDLLNGKPDVITALKSKDAEDLEEVMEQASRAMSNSLKKLLVTDRPHLATGLPDVGLPWSLGQESKLTPTTAMTLLSTAILGLDMTEGTEVYYAVNKDERQSATGNGSTLMPHKDRNDTVGEGMSNDTVRYVLYSQVTEPSRRIEEMKIDSATTEASREKFRAHHSNGSGEINARKENSDEDEIMEFSDFRDYPKSKAADPGTIEINEESSSGFVEAVRNQPESGSTLSIQQILSPTSRTTFDRTHRIEADKENDPTESNVFPEYVDDTPQVQVSGGQDNDGYPSQELEAVRAMMNAVKPKERGAHLNEGIKPTDKISDVNDHLVESSADESSSNNPHEMYAPSANYEGTTSKVDAAKGSTEEDRPVESVVGSFDNEQNDTEIAFYSYEDQRDEPPKNTLNYNYEEQTDEPVTSTTVSDVDQFESQRELQRDKESVSNTPEQEELPANHRIPPKVRRYEDIISEIEPEARAEIFELFASGSSAKRLERILKSRNMSLDELIALRQRGSSKVHLAEVSKIRQEVPRMLEGTLRRVQVVTREEIKKGKDGFEKKERPNESSPSKRIIPETLPTFASLPFSQDEAERKISLKDLVEVRMPPNYDTYTNPENRDRNWRATSERSSIHIDLQRQAGTGAYAIETERQSTTVKKDQTASFRTIDLLPTFASLPFDTRVLTRFDHEVKTSSERESQSTPSTVRKSETIDDSGNLIHGHVEQIAKDEESKNDIRKSSKPDSDDADETRKTLSKVRPSIIASGAILGVTIVVFLAILITCRLRQKQKYTYRNTFSRAVFQGPMMAARKLSNSSSLSTVMVNVVATSTAKRPVDRHESNPGDFAPTSDIDNDSLDANDSWETIPDYMK